MLTLETARQLALYAERYALSNSLALTIAIVDSGANLIYIGRMDGALLGSVEAARRKARCAVLYNRPTRVFEDALAGGRAAILSLPDVMPIDGGVPLKRNEDLVGAVGVSGGTSKQDGEVADAVAAHFLISAHSPD